LEHEEYPQKVENKKDVLRKEEDGQDTNSQGFRNPHASQI